MKTYRVLIETEERTFPRFTCVLSAQSAKEACRQAYAEWVKLFPFCYKEFPRAFCKKLKG